MYLFINLCIFKTSIDAGISFADASILCTELGGDHNKDTPTLVLYSPTLLGFLTDRPLSVYLFVSMPVYFSDISLCI